MRKLRPRGEATCPSLHSYRYSTPTPTSGFNICTLRATEKHKTDVGPSLRDPPSPGKRECSCCECYDHRDDSDPFGGGGDMSRFGERLAQAPQTHTKATPQRGGLAALTNGRCHDGTSPLAPPMSFERGEEGVGGRERNRAPPMKEHLP